MEVEVFLRKLQAAETEPPKKRRTPRFTGEELFTWIFVLLPSISTDGTLRQGESLSDLSYLSTDELQFIWDELSDKRVRLAFDDPQFWDKTTLGEPVPLTDAEERLSCVMKLALRSSETEISNSAAVAGLAYELFGSFSDQRYNSFLRFMLDTYPDEHKHYFQSLGKLIHEDRLRARALLYEALTDKSNEGARTLLKSTGLL